MYAYHNTLVLSNTSVGPITLLRENIKSMQFYNAVSKLIPSPSSNPLPTPSQPPSNPLPTPSQPPPNTPITHLSKI